MKGLFGVLIFAASLFASSAFAFTIEGSSYEDAAANCNIASGGSGSISNCSVASNGEFVCDCEPNQAPGGQTCDLVSGSSYEDAAANCNISSDGQGGELSNCAISDNGMYVCSCCFYQ